ncbi:intermembrane phospholipid transport protein YdbH family protein [Sphingopyxis sp. MWB1]|uniref:intermembrane phospholipid transport protein YdbH family protein n=1 Tax=Sphingopyxis sp. MWB1 TaxID=1537715 RepID=UPI000ABA014E|nr:YdbH domain-containing protein [Sphingopyxis sp. MWB1]
MAIGAGLWAGRAPIAGHFVEEALKARGVPARYTIQKIGLRTQRLSDVVIGDPRRPDLVAKTVEVTLDYSFSGPYVAALSADGVRLYGKFVDGQLSLGALDKFRDPENRDPFSLPDLRVTLKDARARFTTPWGPVAAVLNGHGNLRRDFTGKLALLAPHMAAGNCQAQNLSFYGALTVRNVRPHLVGPLRGTHVDCGGNIRAVAPQLALDLGLSEDLTRWDGKASARVERLAAGDMTAENLGFFASFEGSAEKSDVSIDAHMARLRGADFTAETVAMVAKGAVGSKLPQLTGRLSFAKARASEGWRAAVIDGAKAASGTPLAPLASRASQALARMISDASGSAEFALAGEGPTTRLELRAPQLTSTSGAYFRGSDKSNIRYFLGASRPAVVASGLWRFGGGELPSGTVALDRRADGRLDGRAIFAPYSAPGAQLALAPVDFSGDGSGHMRFATRLRLSGPLADGRVEDLAMPLSGKVALTGELALDGGCHNIRAEQIKASGFTLARPALALCSAVGAALLRTGPRGLEGRIHIPALALHGTSGASPLHITAGRASVDLAAMRWTLADPDIRMGTDEAQTYFAAAQIDGGAGARGMSGHLRGGHGKIGAVPLDMSEIDAEWNWSAGALTLNGALRLTDAEPDRRFFPLVAKAAQLRFANGTITAEAAFDEQGSGRRIVDTVIHHNLASGAGSADLKVKEIRFDEGFQPDQLTSLALGVVANVDGSVVGDGKILWGDAGVTSEGTFATANMNLAAAFGPVTGLTTTLHFEDLLGLRSAPGQRASLNDVNPGIPVREGIIEYRLLGDNRIRVEGGSWPFAGGELLLHPATLDFNADKPRRLSFDLVGVDAAVFLQQFGFDNINATGKFDGTLPVEFDGLGGRIVDGRIDSRFGGGGIAYVGELSNRNLGVIANFAFGALRSLKYDDLSIVMNGDLDGEMITDIRFGGVGQGEGADRNFLTKQIARLPLAFNVMIKAPFRQLVTSAKGFYDPSIMIEQNLPALLRIQQEREAGLNGASAPVQPPASEPVQ